MIDAINIVDQMNMRILSVETSCLKIHIWRRKGK